MFAQIGSDIDGEDEMFDDVAEYLAQISDQERETLQMLVA